MAITTRGTPTRMAYSVVPCPSSSKHPPDPARRLRHPSPVRLRIANLLIPTFLPSVRAAPAPARRQQREPAGRMSVPWAPSATAPGLRHRSSTCARCTARLRRSRFEPLGQRRGRSAASAMLLSTTRANGGGVVQAAGSRSASSRFVKPSDQACWAPTHAKSNRSEDPYSANPRSNESPLRNERHHLEHLREGRFPSRRRARAAPA